MRYIFDTSIRNGKFEIKFTVGESPQFGQNSATHTIDIDETENPKWPVECPEVLKALIDNLRFSVKERTDAERDFNMFMSFLYGGLIQTLDKMSDNKEEMIVENGDPAVVIPKE